MRILFHAAALVVGAAVGIASVTVHRSTVLSLPVGLLLALACTFVTAWAIREMLPRVAASYSLGWLVAFGTAVFGKPEGDFAIAGDLRGYVLMATALAMVVLGVASLAARGAPARRGDT